MHACTLIGELSFKLSVISKKLMTLKIMFYCYSFSKNISLRFDKCFGEVERNRQTRQKHTHMTRLLWKQHPNVQYGNKPIIHKFRSS